MNEKRKELLIGISKLNYLDKEFKPTKEQSAALNDFFKEYVRQNIVYSELEQKIGHNGYIQLIEYVKKRFNDYFCFQKILQTEPGDLKTIFENCAVNFDRKTYREIAKKHGEECVSEVMITFNKMINFCISNRLSNNEFYTILIENYSCPKDVSNIITESFGTNRLYLMVAKLLSKQNS